MSWFPLTCHSMYSPLLCGIQPQQLESRLKELGYAGCGLVDYGNLAGCPSLMKLGGLKVIPGCTFHLTHEDRSLTRIVALARNQMGWDALVKAVSISNRPDHHQVRPQLDIKELAALLGDSCFVLSGFPGSDLGNSPFKEDPWSASSYEEAKSLVKDDWEAVVNASLQLHKELFPHFRVGVCLMDQENLPASLVLARILRHCAARSMIPCVAMADVHYAGPDGSEDQRLLLCLHQKSTRKTVEKSLARSDLGLRRFFYSRRYYLPTLAEMEQLHPPHELRASLDIASACEPVTIGRKPLLPKFQGPKPSPDYLKELCRVGWVKRKLPNKKDGPYAQRIRMELEVLLQANLQDYFLITWDICRHVREDLESIVGLSRGSAGGSLVSYTLFVTGIDPIKHNLLFERFWNAGRQTAGSLPDIDLDFAQEVRPQVTRYLQQKYGREHVAQMATLSTLAGRSAIRDVLRVHDVASIEEINRVTKPVPDKAAITDDLQEMEEQGEEGSVILWALQHRSKELGEWASWKDGKFGGEYGAYFEQAVRLEGTVRHLGKHASGVVVCDRPLCEVVPLGPEEDGLLTLGVDMRDAELMGCVKFDILGTAILDKMLGVERLLRTGSL